MVWFKVRQCPIQYFYVPGAWKGALWTMSNNCWSKTSVLNSFFFLQRAVQLTTHILTQPSIHTDRHFSLVYFFRAELFCLHVWNWYIPVLALSKVCHRHFPKPLLTIWFHCWLKTSTVPWGMLNYWCQLPFVFPIALYYIKILVQSNCTVNLRWASTDCWGCRPCWLKPFTLTCELEELCC